MQAKRASPPSTVASRTPGTARFQVVLAFSLGGLVFWVLMEALFRLLPVERAPLAMEITEQNPLNRRTPDMEFSHSYGWRLDNPHRTRTNAQGFVFAAEFTGRSIDLAGIGDSYMESAQLLPGQHFISLLTAAGVAPEAYAWGTSGAAASDYLAMARWVRERHAPRHFAVLFVKNDVSDSLVCERARTCFKRNTAGSFDLVTQPWYPSRAYALMYRSDLMNYVLRNLRFKPRRLIEPAPVLAPAGVTASIPPERLEMMDVFLARWPEYAGVAPAETALIFDADREAISRGQHGVADPEFVAFMDKARAAGYRVVDMREHFEAHRRTSRARFDFRPFDGHWNPLAHHIAAAAVQEALGLVPASVAPRGAPPISDGPR